MRNNEEKLERIEELLAQLQKNFQDTYQEIHTLLASMKEEQNLELAEEEEALDMEEEFDEEWIAHMDEIFGFDEEA